MIVIFRLFLSILIIYIYKAYIITIVNDTADGGKVNNKEISEGNATYDNKQPQDISNKGTAQFTVKLL